jgi:hypothetical protein
MNLTDEMLIERLKIGDLPPIEPFYNSVGQQMYTSIHPPVSQSDIELAETLLKCSLPPFLKRIYLEVGNGGFGPGGGLAKLLTPGQEDPYTDETFSLVHTTLLFQKWGGCPEHMLFVCSRGCTLYTCIDWFDPMHPIVGYDQTEQIGIEAPSLQIWLQNWLEEAVIA